MQDNPGRVRLNADEPKPALVFPEEPPEFLNQVAKDVWARLRADLMALRLLTKNDVDIFTAYCSTYSRWREAEDFITANGIFFVIREPNKDGTPNPQGSIKFMQQVPHVAVAQKALLMMVKIGAELGLSPASRTRIQVGPEAKPDPQASRIFGGA